MIVNGIFEPDDFISKNSISIYNFFSIVILEKHISTLNRESLSETDHDLSSPTFGDTNIILLWADTESLKSSKPKIGLMDIFSRGFYDLNVILRNSL